MYKDSNGCFSLTIFGISVGIYQLVKAIAIVVIAVISVATIVAVEERTHVISNTLENIKEGLEGIKEGVESLLIAYVASLVLKGQYPNQKEVHHIVAKRDLRALPSRCILWLCGMSIEDSRNKVLVNKSYHKVLHTNVYYVLLNANMIISYAVAGEKGVEKTLEVYKAILGGL